MEYTVTSDIAPGSWDDLIARDPSASFFQTRVWSDVLSAALPDHEPLFAACHLGADLVAGLPVIRRSRGPVTVVESMPFGTYGGLVASDRAPTDAPTRLVSALLDAVAGAGLGQVRIVDFAGRLEHACDGFTAIASEAQVIDLDRSYEEIWAGFRPSARNKVRKAEKAGVTVREARGIDDFIAYHALLEECSERWGTPNPFGEEFFTALAGTGSDAVQMWLAVYEGNVIGGDLNFISATSVFNWGNVSHRESVSLGTVPLMHARAMEDGCRRGLETYNLGGSGGIDAVARFKSAFGTRPVPYTEYVLEKGWMRLGKRLRGRVGGDTS